MAKGRVFVLRYFTTINLWVALLNILNANMHTSQTPSGYVLFKIGLKIMRKMKLYAEKTTCYFGWFSPLFC